MTASNAVSSHQNHFEREGYAYPGLSFASLQRPTTGINVLYAEKEITRKALQRQGASVVGIDKMKSQFDHAMAGLRKEISDLKKSFVFKDRDLDNFLEGHHALISVLKQAITPLKEAFGADGVFRLELATDEEGSRMIYAAALFCGSVQEAARALDQFVDGWWLDHMTKQTSDLAFVYRIWR